MSMLRCHHHMFYSLIVHGVNLVQCALLGAYTFGPAAQASLLWRPRLDYQLHPPLLALG